MTWSMPLLCYVEVLWFFYFKTFWPNYNLDLHSYVQLLSLFVFFALNLSKILQIYFKITLVNLRLRTITAWDVYNHLNNREKIFWQQKSFWNKIISKYKCEYLIYNHHIKVKNYSFSLLSKHCKKKSLDQSLWKSFYGTVDHNKCH